MKNNPKYILPVVLISLTIVSACRFSGVGGAGWDDEAEVETAKQYPPIESKRILIMTEEVSYQTFKQEFDGVFQDFPYSGNLVSGSPKTLKLQIADVPYSVSYENFVLKIFRDGEEITERKLPEVFHMHPISVGIILGKSRSEDRILCRTHSRATTGLHYIVIADGNGDILFEKVMKASDDWDILLGDSGKIIIGGANTKTVITPRE